MEFKSVKIYYEQRILKKQLKLTNCSPHFSFTNINVCNKSEAMIVKAPLHVILIEPQFGTQFGGSKFDSTLQNMAAMPTLLFP